MQSNQRQIHNQIGPLHFSVRADLYRIAAGFTTREAWVLEHYPALAGVALEPSGAGGVILSACNGLLALVVRDKGGRASRSAVMSRPEHGLRDAARARSVASAGFAARLVFDDGDCVIDIQPDQDISLSEIAGPCPDFRARLPVEAVKRGVDLPAHAAERVAIAARQLADAAGGADETVNARFCCYHDGGDGLIVVRFAAWPDAFALIAPDGGEGAAAPATWRPPLWLTTR